MKHLIFVLFFSSAAALYAQSNKTTTVSVTGNALVERQLVGYKALITLSLDEGYYAYPECTNIEEFTAKYYQRLADVGFEGSSLIASPFQFSSYGNQKGNTTLHLETPLLSDIEKLAQVRMNGLNAQYSMKYVLPKAKEEALLKTALDDAAQRATSIAKTSGKRLGKMISITEVLPQAVMWKTYPQDYEEYAKVIVVYELE